MYFNFQLILDDTGWMLLKCFDKGMERYDRLKRTDFVKQFEQNAWKPFQSRVGTMYKNHLQGPVEQFEAKMRRVDAIEGRVGRTLISFVQSGSKIGLNYMELRKLEKGTKSFRKYMDGRYGKRRSTKTS